MSILDKLNEAAAGGGDSKFLTLGEKSPFGTKTKIRFLQEFDEGDKGYNEKFGLAYAVDVHTHPNDFKKQTACTFPIEGACWACEAANGPGENDWLWKPRTNVLINVLVKDKEGNEVVKIFRQKVGKKALGNLLLDYREEYKTLTDRDYAFTRTGTKKNDTTYNLFPSDVSELTFDGELHDLTNVIKVVAAAKQKEYFVGGGDVFGDSAEEWVNEA